MDEVKATICPLCKEAVSYTSEHASSMTCALHTAANEMFFCLQAFMESDHRHAKTGICAPCDRAREVIRFVKGWMQDGSALGLSGYVANTGNVGTVREETRG